MVFYFRSRCGEYIIYMGKDKYENEDLIKYGLPEDVWFHVDDLSSAHVYLRMKPDQTMDNIPEDLLLDCSALVKANSIQGCKKNHVYVVYTRWKNLKKTNDMVDGQVGFHRPENVRRCKVEKNGPIVKALERTREERHPDLAAEQDARLRKIQQQKKQHHKETLRQEEQRRREAQAEKEARSYNRIFAAEKMVSNSEKNATADATAAEEYEDDFF